MEGGRDYIIKKNMSLENGGRVDLKKVYHINNGVDLESFEYNKKNISIEDNDLESECFKVIYAGSIRQVNNVKK